MKRTCALCDALGLAPRQTQSSVGLLTSMAGLLDRAEQTLSQRPSGECHIMVPMCPEHVVDVYRGRVSGVTMAWEMAEAAP